MHFEDGSGSNRGSTGGAVGRSWLLIGGGDWMLSGEGSREVVGVGTGCLPLVGNDSGNMIDLPLSGRSSKIKSRSTPTVREFGQ